MTGSEVFLDTSFAIALSVESDIHHGAAHDLSLRIEESRARYVTTRAVMLEIGNALARQRYRAALPNLLRWIEEDPNVTIVPLSDDLYARGVALLGERTDKEWGLTDCISFVVMQDRGILDAATADDHFRQAGFRPLLAVPR